MKRMPEKVSETYQTKLGTCREQMIRNHPGPRTMLSAVGRILGDCEDERRSLNARIAVKEGRFRNYETRLGKPFEHEAYQEELTDLRDQLKAGLSEEPPEGGTPETGTGRADQGSEGAAYGRGRARAGGTEGGVPSVPQVTARFREADRRAAGGCNVGGTGSGLDAASRTGAGGEGNPHARAGQANRGVPSSGRGRRGDGRQMVLF